MNEPSFNLSVRHRATGSTERAERSAESEETPPFLRRDHARIIFSSVGLVLIIAGLLQAAPAVLCLFDSSQLPFAGVYLASGLALAAAGAALRLLIRPSSPSISPPDGMIIIVLSWTIVCAVGAVPIMAETPLHFSQALFESVSGWTTTGLSLVDVEKVPHLLLLWRSIMQLGGGAGLAIIMLAAFSLPVGAGLYRAEGKGDQLVPNVIRSSKIVLALYSGYAVVGTVAYVAAGMTPFDAVNHTFAAISTGGFSTHSQSIGYWNSPSIEAISIALMIAGNLNFATAYLLVRGKLRAFFLNAELRVMYTSMVIVIPAMFLAATRTVYPMLSKAIRVAVFESVSALTTTGFSTVGYGNWPGSGWLLLIILMLVGGGACSTAGGLKQIRVYLLWRSVVSEIRRLVLPKRSVVEHRIWTREQPAFATERQFLDAASFSFLYLFLYAAGAFAITAAGVPLKDALFEFASSIGTVGLSVGVTSTSLPEWVLWIQIAGMFLGRLEFFVVFGAMTEVGRRLFRAGRARRERKNPRTRPTRQTRPARRTESQPE